MITFETFKDIDKDSGVESWRAYFATDIKGFMYNGPMIRENAPVGYGDTELEAIGNLCLDEIARIEQEEQRKLNGAGLILKNQTIEELLLCGIESTLEALDYAYSGTKWALANGYSPDSYTTWKQREEKRLLTFEAGLKRRGLE